MDHLGVLLTLATWFKPNVDVAQIEHKMGIRMPTTGEIVGRALTSIVIDLPLYAVKTFYQAPIHSMVALCAMMPPAVAMQIMPYVTVAAISFVALPNVVTTTWKMQR